METAQCTQECEALGAANSALGHLTTAQQRAPHRHATRKGHEALPFDGVDDGGAHLATAAGASRAHDPARGAPDQRIGACDRAALPHWRARLGRGSIRGGGARTSAGASEEGEEEEEAVEVGEIEELARADGSA